MARYTKAITAFLTGVVGILGIAGVTTEAATNEWIAGVAIALTPVLVWLFPNKG